MDGTAVREHAQALCDALVAGDIEAATQDFSEELRRNLGEVIAILPLPATSATIESLDAAMSGYLAVLRIVGETDEVEVQIRWKDRDGHPTAVEASHLSRTVTEPGEDVTDGSETDGAGAEDARD